jgi:hypothetical protein
MDDARTQINPQQTGQQEDPEVLQARAQQTRAEINQTVNTIQQRLSPERMKQQMKAVARRKLETMTHHARVKADDWRFNVTERISSNPLPAVLAGVGLVWLMKQAVSAAQDGSGRYEDDYSLTPEEDWPEYAPWEESGRREPDTSSAQSTAETIKHKAQEYGQQTRERVSRWTNQAEEYAGEWKSRAQYQTDRLRARAQARAERAKGEFQHIFYDNPLAVGATVFAVGAAIGLSLPRTQKEDEWLGETRDQVFKQAKATAQEAGNKAKALVGEMTDEIKNAAGEARERVQT